MMAAKNPRTQSQMVQKQLLSLLSQLDSDRLLLIVVVGKGSCGRGGREACVVVVMGVVLAGVRRQLPGLSEKLADGDGHPDRALLSRLKNIGRGTYHVLKKYSTLVNLRERNQILSNNKNFISKRSNKRIHYFC